MQPLMKTFVRLFRVWNLATGSYEYKSPNPTDCTPSHDEMALECWIMANEQYGTFIPFDPEYMKAVSLFQSHVRLTQ
jgi:hypothetical protein